MPKTILTGVVCDETMTLTYSDVCQTYHIPETWLQDMIEHGLLGEQHIPLRELHFNTMMLRRLQKAHRIQHDLAVNASGVVLAMELLDELTQLRDELEVLRRHVHD